MSNFAHGIKTLDIRNVCNKEEPMWLLGKNYSDAQYETFQEDFESLIWMTYRRDFSRMTPYEQTSDAGWGCMLRSGQMILAEAMRRHLLDGQSRLNRVNGCDPIFVKLLRWFIDAPNVDCLYSIHNMVKVGYQYDKLPGEWYGPTTACQVLRDLVSLHHSKLGGSLQMYVPQEGVVYSDDVTNLCTEQEKKKRVPNITQDHSSSTFVDPLLNPPKSQQGSTKWLCSLLILIPLRLGLDKLNEQYVPAMTRIFEIPQCVGIIGGKRGHSVYFVGSQGAQLLILDPHTVQPTAENDDTFPSMSHLSTISCTTPLIIDVHNIDPSLALGFYCHNEEDYNTFRRRIDELGKDCLCPFSVADCRPRYSNEVDMGSMLGDDMMSENSDEEDEYILV